MSDRIDEFIIEAREHLTAIEESLLALEAFPNSPEAASWVDRCFRSIHSIKGDAGFLGLPQINELAHAMESRLDGPQLPSAQMVEGLLMARDRLAVLVDDASRSHLHEIDDVLSQLASTGPVNDVTTIDIDLAQQGVAHSEGLGTFIKQTLHGRKVHGALIQLSDCDLRRGLPFGPIRWIATIDAHRKLTESASTPIKTSVVNPVRIERFSANLTEWSRGDRGLVFAFRKLATFLDLKSCRVEYGQSDLRESLPTGPVVWSGECQTATSLTELQQRFGFEFPDAVLAPPIVSVELESATEKEVPNEHEIVSKENRTARSTSVAQLATGEKSSTLRIQVELLDRMMTLVGELTLVRNQSLIAFADEDGAQRTIIQRLNSVTTELQDVTLRSRMQPVGNLFNKYPRMVRDLARQLGKKVEIDLQGREVEMDKTIVERLSDPLMHLVRNSVDHGIELPEERIAKGKPEVGRIVLSAIHEDGQVHIQIRDDGRGINPQAVKDKALALSLRSEAELDRMSPRELFSLILLPGFSTAKAVTEVSGRGVGMDVVKTNIEQLEGSLNIDSAYGHGCSISLRLPLTLAIIPCLIVTVEGDRFAVPQRDLEEVVCLHPRLTGRIEQAYDTEVYRLREKLLPIVRFSEVLHRDQPFTNEAKTEILATHAAAIEQKWIEYILVLKLGGRRFGLVVDEVRGTQEIVVKPMHPSMKRVEIFNGSTIMGDGRVALIADVGGIVEHARLSFEATLEDAEKKETVRDAAQAHRVLLFESGPLERFALPLLQIRRVEMVSRDRIERVGDQEFITIDGISTRVLRLDKVLNASANESDLPMMSFILPKFISQPMGILVTRIVDTESLALDLQHQPNQDEGILGSAIVRDRLTLFLEMHRLSEKLFGFPERPPAVVSNANRRAKRLLLIDDTAFFREVVKRYLSTEGYEIVTAVHGADGLKRLASDGDFDLIVSDIEMPIMDGWEFARTARRQGIKTPMLALTSLSGVQYENKAKECGYDAYETKLDHDRLLRKVNAMLTAGEMSK